MTKRLLFALFIATLLGSVIVGCQASGPGAETDKVDVMASFYPLYYASQRVGGEHADVTSIVPAGTEPHEFEPTPRQVVSLSSAKMVVYNGAGLEPWIDRVLSDLNDAGVVVVNASQSVHLLEMEDEGDTSQQVPDPHIWLDPVLVKGIVEAIRDAYVQVDPANRASYEANAAAFVTELEALDQKYQATLSQYDKRTIVVSHNAFGYLARRYGLDVVFISGLSPEAEPSPQELAAISRLARERGVKYIFFETLVSPRLAQTVATEVGAQTLVFDPLEGLTDEDIASGESYISVMEQNLDNLKIALEAQQ